MHIERDGPAERIIHGAKDGIDGTWGSAKGDTIRQVPAAGKMLNIATTFALYYGRAQSPLVRVVPDSRQPNMWRVSWPDGALSDMVNLSRAKDACVVLCERGPPARNRRRFRWELERSKTAAAAPPMRRRARRATALPIGLEARP
jgi:hypothetical protein